MSEKYVYIIRKTLPVYEAFQNSQYNAHKFLDELGAYNNFPAYDVLLSGKCNDSIDTIMQCYAITEKYLHDIDDVWYASQNDTVLKTIKHGLTDALNEEVNEMSPEWLISGVGQIYADHAIELQNRDMVKKGQEYYDLTSLTMQAFKHFLEDIAGCIFVGIRAELVEVSYEPQSEESQQA